MTTYKQEKPSWCPHKDCKFKRRVMDDACAGHLPEPVPHDGDFNNYTLCLNGVADSGGVFDLQVNDTDLGWLRWLFDALDGKKTSWLSKRGEVDKQQEHKYVVVDAEAKALKYVQTPYFSQKVLVRYSSGESSQFDTREDATQAAHVTRKFYSELSKKGSDYLKQFPEYSGMPDWAIMTIENYLGKATK